MVHNLGSRRQLLTFLAAASFSSFGPMSIARDIANGTFTPHPTFGCRIRPETKEQRLFGLGTNTAAEGWVDRAASFFRHQVEKN